MEREHRDYAPVLEDLKFVWETNPRSKALNQFLTFKSPRTYRVFGDTLSGQDNGGYSRSQIVGATGGALEAGVLQRLYISAEREKQPDAVELRFFPPVDGDPGESWMCPCDRDSLATSHDDAGHWVVRKEIPPRSVPMVRWA